MISIINNGTCVQIGTVAPPTTMCGLVIGTNPFDGESAGTQDIYIDSTNTTELTAALDSKGWTADVSI